MPLLIHIQGLNPIHTDQAKKKAIFSLMYVLYSLIFFAYYLSLSLSLAVNRPLFTQNKKEITCFLNNVQCDIHN